MDFEMIIDLVIYSRKRLINMYYSDVNKFDILTAQAADLGSKGWGARGIILLALIVPCRYFSRWKMRTRLSR